jgi:ABC-2 type transport system ATP-binding protein
MIAPSFPIVDTTVPLADGPILVRVSDYHKSYRETVAVAGLSFHVAAGSVLGLVGPNGAGKTTTMRALCGIIPPTLGTLQVAGHDVVKDPIPAKRVLAYVPDDPKLFDTLTVWEHLEFVAAAYRVSNFAPRADALLEQFELTEKRNTVAQELSRGMRQKVAVCCAYLHEPRVLLFDEPLTGLDPRGIRTLKETIAAQARAGAALIISSHLLGLVEDLCDQLLIMHKGRGLYFGPTAQARAMFASAGQNATLEEVFFKAIEG